MESSDLIYGIVCGEGKFVLRQYEGRAVVHPGNCINTCLNMDWFVVIESFMWSHRENWRWFTNTIWQNVPVADVRDEDGKRVMLGSLYAGKWWTLL